MLGWRDRKREKKNQRESRIYARVCYGSCEHRTMPVQYSRRNLQQEAKIELKANEGWSDVQLRSAFSEKTSHHIMGQLQGPERRFRAARMEGLALQHSTTLL